MMLTCPKCSAINAPGTTNCHSCNALLTPPVAEQNAIPAPVSEAAPPATSAALPSGTNLNQGAFRVGQVLGQGGFGITYKGGDVNLRRVVAIKEFFPQGSVRQGMDVFPPNSDQVDAFVQWRQSFLQEARTLAKFRHPSIVRIFTIFEENNTAYMVMKFLDGQTLATQLKTEVLGEAEALDLARQIGGALEVVHAENLIHRDLKPENIILTEEGRPMLIDFGTARPYAIDQAVRQTALITPGYAPLEQYGTTGQFGAYTDVYALAATLYHAVTGQAPPPATDRATGTQARPIQTFNPRISPTFSQAIEWGMQLKAEERPQTITAFLAALGGQDPNVAVARTPSAPRKAEPLPGFDPQKPWEVPPAARPIQESVGTAPMTQATPVHFAAPIGTQLWMRFEPNGQLLTNAHPNRALDALGKAMQKENIGNVQVNYELLQARGQDALGGAMQGQLTITPEGNLIALQMPDALGSSQSKTLMETVLRGTEMNLRLDPHAMAPPPTQPTSKPPVPPGVEAMYTPRVQGGEGGGVLTLGILGFCCCPIFAPFAWIKGNNALAIYGDQDPGDRTTVHIGRALGIVSCLLWVIWVIMAMLGN